MQQDDIQDLVRQKVANLRPKLLDLSRRNPLISTRLTPRSSSHIRVVDELPDVLFFNLNNDQEMRLIALPEIDEDPKDEDTKEFRDALANARITDENYQGELDNIARDAEDYLDRARRVERALKDRVRGDLGMPARQKKAEVNLAQHARNNGISPNYELPDSSTGQARHADNDIQTLLLPKDLERKLNAIGSKCRTWIQETGVNVLHIAFGFLEWSEPNQAETSFAPLILVSAAMEKRRSRTGTEFWISGAGEEPEINAVLAEKLKIEFGIDLPKLSGPSVEEYFAEIARIAPKNVTWRVRRQVAIGVFPSARMAMYHDLAPDQPFIGKSKIVGSLLGGSTPTSAAPFADDYEVDQPSIEKWVPCIVLDADSSQFSTLVDVARGNNLAVEGPPGTGKSQTIVNAIAGALAAGKKVLFVAEKLAALNVVKSRLEAVGLGAFLLPLQAERSTREQVIASVRERIEMGRPPTVRNYEDKLSEYKAVRAELATYIKVLTSPVRESGMTVHEVLSKAISSAPQLSSISAETLAKCKVPDTYLSTPGLERLRLLAAALQQARAATAQVTDAWSSTNLKHPDPFTLDTVCALAGQAASAFHVLAEDRDALRKCGLDDSVDAASLADLGGRLRDLMVMPPPLQAISPSLLDAAIASEVSGFARRCNHLTKDTDELSSLIGAEPSSEIASLIEILEGHLTKAGLTTLDVAVLEALLDQARSRLSHVAATTSSLRQFAVAVPASASWPVMDIVAARRAIVDAGREALLLRTPATADPHAAVVVKRVSKEVRRLAAVKASLVERAIFGMDESPAMLREAAATLRVAGLLDRLFSRQYRQAVRLSRSLTRGVALRVLDAAGLLEEIATFLSDHARLREDPQAIAVFGPHFHGLETQLEPFERLVAFQEVVASFASASQRPLRSFLREAETDELEMIPDVSGHDEAKSYSELEEELGSIDKRITELADALAAARRVQEALTLPVHYPVSRMQELVGRIRSVLRRREALESEAPALAAVLGDLFQGWRTDTTLLDKAVSWASESRVFSDVIRSLVGMAGVADAEAQIRKVLVSEDVAASLLMQLSDAAQMAPDHFAGGRTARDTANRLRRASEDREGLSKHARLSEVMEEFAGTGLSALVEAPHAKASDLSRLVAEAEAVAIQTLARDVYAKHRRDLSKFSGEKLSDLRRSLATKDKEIIRLARRQLAWKIYTSAKPPPGNGTGRKSTWTEMALVENEIGKQQRFIPVRDLTERAGRTLQELKPCWMMSPLAVAQYIKKGALEFDLCIIDEASQMPPEAALGALLRCKQTMIVGDTNQLPPSNFFKTVIDDEDADEDETVLNESILELANSTFRPARRLRWHYRSRHSALIRFSNRLVYDDKLMVFPSATEELIRMGVEFRKVDGLYKAGTNPIEARAVVDAVLEFMRNDPGRSLGVVTLNQKQRDLITEEFEYAIRRDQAALKYVEEWRQRNDGLEEFFVKNLENVQGDERDVIFIATVYGPETMGGRVMQRFGPINGLTGKRRLNVLFSRAKEKIVTFSSMRPEDILADEVANAGVYMLKRWLEYSATGLLEAGATTNREPDSDFEIFVMAQIHAMGFETVPQVGAAGYFIDIGVRHPDWKYGYVLGVECDGASYHSAKSARDRDRLRQEVLEGLGWHLHRIWSTDWFENPRREAERLRQVLSARLTILKTMEADFAHRPTPPAPESERASEPDLFSAAAAAPSTPPPRRSKGIEIGDTVRVRYLTGDEKVLQVKISGAKNNPDEGILNSETPLAKALLGAEIGDEVEVLIGSYVRKAIIESISKAGH